MPAQTTYPFRNVILCDDIREERGNKRSLMGVFSGDLVLPKFPAKVQVAIYCEFLSDERGEFPLTFLLWLDDEEIGTARMTAVVKDETRASTIGIPKGIVSVDKESRFRVTASVNDKEPIEILNKRILARPPAPAGEAISSPSNASQQPASQSPPVAPKS